MEIDIRKFENSKKQGYLFYISYRGKAFTAFDENTDKKTVKSEFKKVLNELGITWAKGVQQAARTDAKVNGDENILYISTYFNGDKESLTTKMNKKLSGMKVLKIEKTFPDLVIPDLVERRIYHYSYPESKIDEEIETVKKRAVEISGYRNFTDFTDFNGKKLKEQKRDVNVEYDGEKLVFNGVSFLPKQVRMMSAYIFTGEKKVFPAKYLTLHKVIMKAEFNDLIFEKTDIEMDGAVSVERVGDLTVFNVEKAKKGEFIGRRGKNIKKLRKEYGKVVVKDV